MPHMNEVLELLERAHKKLIEYDIMLMENGKEDLELNDIGIEIEQMLKEWEIIKTVHAVRQ